MITLLEKLFKKRPRHGKDMVFDEIKQKYAYFQDLLSSNLELLNIISDIERKMRDHVFYDHAFVENRSKRAVFLTNRMIESLNALSQNDYRHIIPVFEKIAEKILNAMNRQKVTVPDLILPYSLINRSMVDAVGGKNANLGEMSNCGSLRIPAGFAITTTAYHLFVEENRLTEQIFEELAGVKHDDIHQVEWVSETIQRLIFSARIPVELENAIFQGFDDYIANKTLPLSANDHEPVIAMRSSAVGEDGELSFAGQYLSVLNVTRNRMLQTYKYVVASLFTPRAISYRHQHGISQTGCAMGVACLQMVESVASGVMYSQHPFKETDGVIISAVWGLGQYAVDGHISPDVYTISRDEMLAIIEKQIPDKPVQLVMDPDGGLIEVPVPREKQSKPCLTDRQIKSLAEQGLKLQAHYQCPQDTEWALDPEGNLIYLQTRPIRITSPENSLFPKECPPIDGYEVLLEGGQAASPGFAVGYAFHVNSEAELNHFPAGAILVARHSSPKFVVAMQKAAAIVTDAGSITGHMASLCREFDVPSLLDTKTATRLVPHSELITVDTISRRIYRGSVSELNIKQEALKPVFRDTPARKELLQAAQYITPLNLLDPQSSDFKAENCRTLHDIMRFVHEHSYLVMFRMGDTASGADSGAKKLVAPIPLDLYVIDLGGGVAIADNAGKKIRAAQIISIPFKAFLDGLLDEKLRNIGPRPVELSGFLSVVAEQIAVPGNTPERLGERCYALVSDKYLNFSSRVGYHYSVLDCYCGKSVNKNYISFQFKGGAANDIRRNRRARAIAAILKTNAFAVDRKEDQVDARFHKYELAETKEMLVMLGRLLQFTRQMDMLMIDDDCVDAVVKNFLEDRNI